MEGGGGERKRKAGAIHLHWDKLLPDNNDHPPPSLVIEPAKSESMKVDSGDQESLESDGLIKKLSDSELLNKISRATRMLPIMSSKLPDGGEKLRGRLSKYKAELESRKLVKKNDDNSDRVVQPADKCTCTGATDNLSQVETVPASSSAFAIHFTSKLDDNKTKSFSEELSILNHCDKKDTRENRHISGPKNENTGLSSRQVPFNSPSQLSANIDDPKQSNYEQFRSLSPASPPPSCRLLYCAKKESASHSRTTRGSRRKNGTVVLLDEELDFTKKDQAENKDERMKAFRMYFPSRDDPEAVEICHSDMECLEPQSYLSSTIMNFYIKFLERLTSANSGKRCNFHFFSTYFYPKLKQDVLNEADKETSFKKFRRWWRGVNIFEKAYIFLPINEHCHWSLIIICMPSKEDDFGPFILHLDSLGLHSGRKLFNDVKSFLVEEWKFLRREEPLSEPPMGYTIWDRLSRRIYDKEIEVPQQKNDYDCGLFVLYFMKIFIKEAPERLKKKDLEMFGRKWFKPEEASNLRQKIRDKLEQEFKKANEKDVCILGS